MPTAPQHAPRITADLAGIVRAITASALSTPEAAEQDARVILELLEGGCHIKNRYCNGAKCAFWRLTEMDNHGVGKRYTQGEDSCRDDRSRGTPGVAGSNPAPVTTLTEVTPACGERNPANLDTAGGPRRPGSAGGLEGVT